MLEYINNPNVAMINVLSDDTFATWSCEQWGMNGIDNFPIIIDDYDDNTFSHTMGDWFDISWTSPWHIFLDHNFTYNLSDGLGWFNESDNVSIDSGNNESILVAGFINQPSLVNSVIINICPDLIYDTECKTLNIELLSCSEFESSTTCLDCTNNIIGDINYDQMVNILDVLTMVNCILDNNCNLCFDLNEDQELNILDILIIVNIVLDEL